MKESLSNWRLSKGKISVWKNVAKQIIRAWTILNIDMLCTQMWPHEHRCYEWTKCCKIVICLCNFFNISILVVKELLIIAWPMPELENWNVVVWCDRQSKCMKHGWTPMVETIHGLLTTIQNNNTYKCVYGVQLINSKFRNVS